MIQNWRQTELKDPADPWRSLMVDNIDDEVYQKYDGFFVFDAAMVAYLHAEILET